MHAHLFKALQLKAANVRVLHRPTDSLRTLDRLPSAQLG